MKPEAEWRPGLTVDALIAEMDKALQFPGVSNAWTMPVKARIDMLATGIRTPVGVKVLGRDLTVIDGLAREIESAIKSVPGTSSAFAERIIGGYYLEIEPDRDQLARYGLMIGDVQQVISNALGAETVTTTVEGRERYGVSLRYPRDMRSDPDTIAREVLVPLASGASIPLGQVAADQAARRGRPRSRTENAQLAAYIFVDARDRDLGSYVADARQAVAEKVKVSAGLLCRVERAVRILRAGERAARDRRADHAAHHPAAAVPELPQHDGNADRHAVAAVRARRRAVAHVVAGLQPAVVAVAVGFIALAGVAAETGVGHADLSAACARRSAEAWPSGNGAP